MAEKNLDDLFHDTLKDIYYAERKILAALPKMAKAAESAELKAAFEMHRDQTESQVERLVEIFGIIDKKPQGKTCPAIDGIIEEGAEIMKDFKGTAALDAGLIGAAQAVEHYEIARYGTLKRWAQMLGHGNAVELLNETLEEEEQTDVDLTALADASINEKAQMAAE
jgi:ferritin-like metal-binding protein YciE